MQNTEFFTVADLKILPVSLVPTERVPALCDAVNGILHKKIGTGAQWDEFIADYGPVQTTARGSQQAQANQ